MKMTPAMNQRGLQMPWVLELKKGIIFLISLAVLDVSTMCYSTILPNEKLHTDISVPKIREGNIDSDNFQRDSGVQESFGQDRNKTLLQMQLEEYYNEADIEFVNIDQKNESNFDSITGEGISETIFQENDQKHKIDNNFVLDNSVEKYYRDTFMDNVYKEINGEKIKTKEKHDDKKRVERDVIGDKPKKRSHQITGDTVLHIRSGVSDVINSDIGDLVKGMKKKSESYVDDIMIHPSEFLHEDLDAETNVMKDGEMHKEEEGHLADGKTSGSLKTNGGNGEVSDGVEKLKTNAEVNGYKVAELKLNVKNSSIDKEEMIKDGFGISLSDERWTQKLSSEEKSKMVGEPPQKAKKYPGKILLNSSSRPVNVEGSFYRHSDKTADGVEDDAEVVSGLDVKQLLECSLPADFRVTSWQKDGEDMSLLNDPRLQIARHALVLRVAREHAGRWNCLGRDINGKMVTGRPVRLIVLEAPSPPYLEVFGRRLDPGNVFLPAKEGSDLELACRAEGGKPDPSLTWTPEVPGLVAYAQRNDVDGAVTIAKLMVRRSHHNLTISCSASHPSLVGDLVASTRLHVQYAPRFGISRVPGFGFPLAEGSAVSLRCEVDSNPPAGARWQKDDADPPVAQSADGFLNFTSVRREHSGWYKCVANHAFGNYSSIGYFLNVRYEVDVTQEPDFQQAATGNKMEVALGGALQLQCPPGSSGCWGRPGSLLQKQAGELRCRGLAKEDARKLEMLAAAVSHQGISGDGGPPVARAVDPSASIAVNEGSPAELTAEFCADPSATRVVWLGAGRALQPGHTIGSLQAHYTENSTSTSGCRTAVLSIERAVATEHAGEYSLVVRSPRGLAEAVFSLQVKPKLGHVWNFAEEEEDSNDTSSDAIDLRNLSPIYVLSIGIIVIW